VSSLEYQAGSHQNNNNNDIREKKKEQRNSTTKKEQRLTKEAKVKISFPNRSTNQLLNKRKSKKQINKQRN
jgi:hypothetical protein